MFLSISVIGLRYNIGLKEPSLAWRMFLSMSVASLMNSSGPIRDLWGLWSGQ